MREVTWCPDRRQAFSTLEILIAVVILLLAILPMLDLLVTAGKQSRQTADYASSLTLITKVAEELRLAGWENPHLADSLKRDLDDGRTGTITDGNSPFFRSIEDDESPYGTLEEGRDAPIDQTYPTLARPLKSYAIGFTSRYRSLPTTGDLLEINLGLTWRGDRDRPLEMSLPVCVAERIVHAQRPKALEDRTLADSLIRGLLYPDQTGKSLAQAVSAVGGQLDMVRALGDCLLVTSLITASEGAAADEIARLRAQIASTDPALTRARAALALAVILEGQAANRLDALVALVTPLDALAAGWTPTALGRTEAPSTLVAALATAASLDSGFGPHVVDAVATYRQAYNQPLGTAMSSRVRARTLVRMVDVLRTSAITLGWPDLDYLKSTLQEFQKQQTGHNPNFAAWAESELDSCRDRAALLADAAPWLPTAIDEFRRALKAALLKLQTG